MQHLFLRVEEGNKSRIFSHIFRNLNNVSENVLITFTSNGMEMQTMNKPLTYLMVLRLDKTWFEDYKCIKPFNVGINTDIIEKIFKCMNGHCIEMEVTKKKQDYLNINFVKPDKIADDSKIFNKEFTLSLIDIDYDNLNVPETEYKVDIEMESKYFINTVGELKDFGENIEFICSEKQIELKMSGDDMVQMNTIMKFEDLLSYQIEEGAEINTTYNIKFIQEISQFMKINSDLTVNINENLPAKISCRVNNLSLSEVTEYEELKNQKSKISKEVKKCKDKNKERKEKYSMYKTKVDNKEKLNKKEQKEYNKYLDIQKEMLGEIKKIKEAKEIINGKIEKINDNRYSDNNYLEFYLAPKVDDD